MSIEQECLDKRTEPNKIIEIATIAVTSIDKIVESALKDLPIAKLYQIVRIGANIAYGLNNLQSGKLKKFFQKIIVKLLKIFNIYFFILKVKITAAKKYTEIKNNEKKKDHLEKIFKLDMNSVDNELDEFYELNTSNNKKSLFSKVTADIVIEKFTASIKNLETVINITLGHLTLLLSINKYVDDLNIEETEEFKKMNSPIRSDKCENMNFELIFQTLTLRIMSLKNQLENNKVIVDELKKKYEENQQLFKEMGCKADEVIFEAEYMGVTYPICKKINTTIDDKIDNNEIKKVLTESQDILPTSKTSTPSTSKTSTPSTSKTSTPSTTPAPKKKNMLTGLFNKLTSTKSKYFKYKEQYLEIKKNII